MIPRAKGVAVCVYRNAKLTLDYLFDVSQTTGKEIHPTDWQLSDEMKKALTERLSYAHGFPKQDFPQALYAMASESVAENYNHFLQELKQETKGHLFTEIPAGGFEAQYIQLLTDSISYFIGKKCHLPDEEIQLSDGMATVSHFNTLPLVAHLGTAVTALSKGIIYDCGVMQTPTSIFRDAEHRLLCGSVLPYEIPVFHKALSECGSLEVRPVAICVPQEIQEYCTELFGEDVQIAAASHDLFAKQVNGQIYRPLVEKYIAGEKRL